MYNRLLLFCVSCFSLPMSPLYSQSVPTPLLDIPAKVWMQVWRVESHAGQGETDTRKQASPSSAIEDIGHRTHLEAALVMVQREFGLVQSQVPDESMGTVFTFEEWRNGNRPRLGFCSKSAHAGVLIVLTSVMSTEYLDRVHVKVYVIPVNDQTYRKGFDVMLDTLNSGDSHSATVEPVGLGLIGVKFGDIRYVRHGKGFFDAMLTMGEPRDIHKVGVRYFDSYFVFSYSFITEERRSGSAKEGLGPVDPMFIGSDVPETFNWK